MDFVSTKEQYAKENTQSQRRIEQESHNRQLNAKWMALDIRVIWFIFPFSFFSTHQEHSIHPPFNKQFMSIFSLICVDFTIDLLPFSGFGFTEGVYDLYIYSPFPSNVQEPTFSQFIYYHCCCNCCCWVANICVKIFQANNVKWIRRRNVCLRN